MLSLKSLKSSYRLQYIKNTSRLGNAKKNVTSLSFNLPLLDFFIYVVHCAIWQHLYNFKNVKNTHGGVLILVTKINTPPWVFTFFKLYRWYQIAQRITFSNNWCNKRYFQREHLPRAKLRITSITTVVQKTSNVLQNS